MVGLGVKPLWGRDWGVGDKRKILPRTWSRSVSSVEMWSWSGNRAGSEIKLVGLELKPPWGWDGRTAVVVELIVGLCWSYSEDPAVTTWSSFT